MLLGGSRAAGARPARRAAPAARPHRAPAAPARRARAPPPPRAAPGAPGAGEPAPGGGGDGGDAAPGGAHRSQGLYRLLKGGKERAGAEYGEGFVHYLPAGGVLRVDVDAMNENLRVNGALRLRHAMRPDEAFGIVLNFDGAGGRSGGVGALAAGGLGEPSPAASAAALPGA
jgi:hypothetical protein